MHFPRFWQRAVETIPGHPRGEKICAWGWSDESERAALDIAKTRAVKIAGFVAAGKFPQDHYGYERPPREPVLEKLPDGNAAAPACVTRNSYGCRVLNSTQFLMADVDFRRPGEGPGLLGGIKKLFGGSGKHPEEESILAKTESWIRTNGSWGIRVYRTFGGARLLVTHQPMHPKDRQVSQFFDAVGADPQYRRLCSIQESFRARLSPKPWRCGVRRVPGRWPFASAAEESAFEAWRQEYENASRSKSTCRLLATMGRGGVAQVLEGVLHLHDREACGTGPLA